jgi:pSer/pThr/pTyr-binding forkhead associated (FHA) protein
MQKTKWFLEGLIKGDSRWNIPIDKGETQIGRSTECDLILQAPSVSRIHGIIKVFGDGVYLKDLGSRNGTYINGVRIVDEKKLNINDIIRFGELEFCLRELEEGDEKTQIDMEKQQETDFIHLYGLSSREEEVLYLLIKGLKTKEIARRLFISQGTAKNHVLSIYAKTDCHSRIEIARKYQDF